MTLKLRTAEECGVRFETGVPVVFEFVRNTEKAPHFGARFQQNIEPAGLYLQHACGFPQGELRKGWVRGMISFESPLVLSFSDPVDELEPLYGPHSWKAELQREFGGKRGIFISRKIVAAGYDGIVTVRQDGSTSEIVSLRSFVSPGWGRVFG